MRLPSCLGADCDFTQANASERSVLERPKKCLADDGSGTSDSPMSPKPRLDVTAAKGWLDGRGRSDCEETQKKFFGPLPNTRIKPTP